MKDYSDEVANFPAFVWPVACYGLNGRPAKNLEPAAPLERDEVISKGSSVPETGGNC